MSTGEPAVPGTVIEQVLEGRRVGADAPPQVRALEQWVVTLRRPARAGELRGEAAAVAAYTWAMRTQAVRARSQRRLRPAVSAKVVAATVVGALGLGGIAAAVDGSLPAPLQQIAHELFGAPPPADAIQGDDATGGYAPVQIPTEMSASTPSPLPSPSIPASTEKPAPEQRSAGVATESAWDALAESATEPDDLAQSGTSPSESGQAEPLAPAEPADSSPSTTEGSSAQPGGPPEHVGGSSPQPDGSRGKPAELPEHAVGPPAEPSRAPDDPGPPGDPPGSPQLWKEPPAEAGTPPDLPASEPAGRSAALTRPG